MDGMPRFIGRNAFSNPVPMASAIVIMPVEDTVFPDQKSLHSGLCVLMWVPVTVLLIDVLLFALWRYRAGVQMQPVDFITGEAGVLEVLQAVLLVLSAVLCFYASAKTPARNGLGGLVNFALGLIFIMLLLRELEIDALGASRYWVALENVLRAGIGVAAAIYFIYAIPKIPEILRAWRSFMRSRALWLLVAGVAFYVAGWPFDKQVFAIGQGLNLFIEELLELNACIAFCLGAFLALNAEDALNAGAG